jgi:soluble lytic murein transglycosylase
MAIIIILATILFISRNAILENIYPQKYEEIVQKYSKEYNIEENLIYAVIKAESNFKENAKSNKSAIGLMQIVPETAEDIARKNQINMDFENIEEELQNAEININIGTKYLQILLERYENKEIALAAYNAGIGTVDNWIEKGIIKSDGTDVENIPYTETNNYVRKILRDYEIYENLFGKSNAEK